VMWLFHCSIFLLIYCTCYPVLKLYDDDDDDDADDIHSITASDICLKNNMIIATRVVLDVLTLNTKTVTWAGAIYLGRVAQKFGTRFNAYPWGPTNNYEIIKSVETC